jgi:hypothetical protein
MPKLERPVPETDQLIVRPIAIAIIQEILVDRMGMSSDVTINFPGYAETVAQPKGLISSKNEDPRFPTSDKLFIDVSETYVEDWLPSSQTKTPDQIPLFLNKDLELEMRPIYASMEMRITVRYRAKGKTDARRFYDYMMLKVPNREDTWLHTVKYAFGVPEVYMAILKEIHRLTELTDGYNEDFETFFAKWVNPRYGELTDQAGKNTYGVFSETQTDIIGFFDMSTTPDFGGKKDDTDVWEIEFPYVIRYDKPKDVYFSYPIVIHNTVLSSKYRGKAGMERRQDHLRTSPKSINAMKAAPAAFAAGRLYNDFPGRYFPLFDEFMPRMVPDNTVRIFTALVLIGDEKSKDPNLLMNIADLEGPEHGMRVNDCIKAFLKSDRQHVTKARHSALHVGLYMGRLLMDGSFIEMDEDLNIRSTKPLNKRKYYHIRLSIVSDLTMLTEDAKTRLRGHPCVVNNLLEYVTPENTLIPKVDVVGGRVTPPSLDTIAEWLKNRRQTVTMKTVQNTKISAVYKPK